MDIIKNSLISLSGSDSSKGLSSSRGVTLIELSVVLAILMILITIGIIEYKDYDKITRRNSSLASSKALADALRMYKLDNKGSYTTNIDELAPYVNLTSLRTSFDTTTLSPLQGVQIMQVSTVYCIFSAPRGVTKRGTTPDQEKFYGTFYCLEADSSDNRTKDIPACCYSKAGSLCDSASNWYACEQGEL